VWYPPTCTSLGGRWESGEVRVVQEHLASNLIRGRLLALARAWERGNGPMTLFACRPGEQHELSLIGFGPALWGRGWRIAFLAADTPIRSVADAASTFRPETAVLAR
jgi:MerR family transcriptional regulator, light-induced transcriptional regulator